MNTAKKIETKKPTHLQEVISDNEAQKLQIETLKKAISEKIKHPDLAKKAALILSEMLAK